MKRNARYGKFEEIINDGKSMEIFLLSFSLFSKNLFKLFKYLRNQIKRKIRNQIILAREIRSLIHENPKYFIIHLLGSSLLP
jgi:hypothetical protein